MPCVGSRPTQGIAVPAGDVCVEFPSVLALAEAGRGAAIIPRTALMQAQVTVCDLPLLGGRYTGAWHQAGPAHSAPATGTILDALARAASCGKHPDHPADTAREHVRHLMCDY